MIQFTIFGEAKPAGSKTGFPIKRKNGTYGVAMSDSSGAKGKAWRMLVDQACQQAVAAHKSVEPDTVQEIYSSAIELRIVFYIQRPKGHYKTKNGSPSQELNAKGLAEIAPTVRPDVLKLARAIEDAMKSIAYHDDSQIVSETLDKRYCHWWEQPKTLVTISVFSGGDQSLPTCLL